MIAIDIDGTLLRSNNTLAPEVAQAVREAANLGVRVVLATARPPQDMRAIQESLGLSTFQINFNGGLICAGENFNVMLHQPLNPKLAHKIVRLARKMDPAVQLRVDCLNKWYTDRANAPANAPTNTQPPEAVGEVDEILTHPVTRLLFLTGAVKMHKIREAITERYGEYVTMPYCGDMLLQITHMKANKANALKRMAEYYEIPRERVMAIGDAPNDVSMIRWAGIGVGMINGWMKTLEAADELVRSNDHNGVAEAIRRYVFADHYNA